MFRFSLSTLLICIFVAAVVLTYCMNLPVREHANPNWQYHYSNPGEGEKDYYFVSDGAECRAPHRDEIVFRLAWAEPPALITTLLAIQAVRKIWRSIPHKSKAASPDLDSSR